jgi:enoyl-[acyl-carrier protein] reductase/trans-2-enoyl-CoA reductase (NAD+)
LVRRRSAPSRTDAGALAAAKAIERLLPSPIKLTAKRQNTRAPRFDRTAVGMYDEFRPIVGIGATPMIAIINDRETQGSTVMIIKPRIRNNICTNAHPLGCAAQVQAQIRYVRARDPVAGPRRVLVIGASNGYGLAARIASGFSSGAATVGIAYEQPATRFRTATAGWYNSAAFKAEAEKAGLGAWNLNGDAFADETKAESLQLVKDHLGQVDFLVYSIAAPRRIDPQTGDIYSSVIKPIDRRFTAKTVNFITGEVSEVSAEPASADDVRQTVKVMGGEDWLLWIRRLQAANLLSKKFLTLAFSYIGPEFLQAIYRSGTMGAAKRDLEKTAGDINRLLEPLNGRALISVNKALITRASAVIPGVPLYISLLYRIMKEKNLHEGCIQQMYRMYHERLFARELPMVDDRGFIRMDDWELREDVQQAVRTLWDRAETGNIKTIADIEGLREEFLRHHGFGMPGVDYDRELEPDIY